MGAAMNGFTIEHMIGIGIFICVPLFIFLICRSLVLWFCKIDRIVFLLEKIESHLNTGARL